MSCRHAVRFLVVLLTLFAATAIAVPAQTARAKHADGVVVVVDRGDALAAFLLETLVAKPPQRPQRTVLYQVDTKGDVASSLHSFRRVVAETLFDPRGWSLGGSVLYLPVHAGGSVRIWLASPRAVAAAHPTCDARYSCRVGDDVYINDVRWRTGSTTFAGRGLAAYRRYVVNHEVGHLLGLDHRRCRGTGAAALVMQQQTIALDGCEARVWPQSAEHDRARRRVVGRHRDAVR